MDRRINYEAPLGDQINLGEKLAEPEVSARLVVRESTMKNEKPLTQSMVEVSNRTCCVKFTLAAQRVWFLYSLVSTKCTAIDVNHADLYKVKGN